MTPRALASGAAALGAMAIAVGWVMVERPAGFNASGIRSAAALTRTSGEMPTPMIEVEFGETLRANAKPAEIKPAGLLSAEPDAATPAPAATQPANDTTNKLATEPASPPVMQLASADPADVVPAAKSTDVSTTDVKTLGTPSPAVQAALRPDAPDGASVSPSGDGDAPELATGDPTKDDVNGVEVLDECLDAKVCVDRYLWALYQRTPKEDTEKVRERRKVQIKRRGKHVTVTRTFVKLVPANFTWKDPKAAERAGMPMMDYVIGGMDRGFKLKLFRALHAASRAGLQPGITSAFRDDYRQSIATGLKAASNRSFHGGSLRGGYGHGLAADVVSVKGATRDERYANTEILWKWLDANGRRFGIGRPYLAKDPPHFGPVDGEEWVMTAPRRVKQLAANRKPTQVAESKPETPAAQSAPPQGSE